jgi:Cu-processing system ATP-binding protein
LANAIDVRNVGKSFGDVRALDDLSLHVEKGEMFGLIGHNGAGKSTLFKLMLGLAAADAGNIDIHGTPIAGPAFRQVRRRIGYLPESFVTYDSLTGIEVLKLFADLKQVPHAACAPLLARVGLGAAAERRVRGYSKGMRQRLGFAQALLGEPDLIFLDEPTNGLDPEGIHEFYQTLRDVQAQGTTIVITSHILAEIQQRVDRLVILNGGRVAAQGTLMQLRGNTELPSTIHVKTSADQALALAGQLARVPDVTTALAPDGVAISCANARKVNVLGIVAALPHAVHDIAIHEPSLEDLFLGYGGAHVGTH